MGATSVALGGRDKRNPGCQAVAWLCSAQLVQGRLTWTGVWPQAQHPRGALPGLPTPLRMVGRLATHGGPCRSQPLQWPRPRPARASLCPGWLKPSRSGDPQGWLHLPLGRSQKSQACHLSPRGAAGTGGGRKRGKGTQRQDQGGAVWEEWAHAVSREKGWSQGCPCSLHFQQTRRIAAMSHQEL